MRSVASRLAELLLAASAVVIALTSFADAKAKFDSDESQWIGTISYFQSLFVERDLSPEAWPDEEWTRTQPMVARYVMGAWLMGRGYGDLRRLDPVRAYHEGDSLAENRRFGRAPSDQLLAEARLPMRALAALAVAALYGVVRVVAGPIGAVVAALLASGSPYLRHHLVRAMAEAPLMFFLLAALLTLTLGLRRARPGRPAVGWAVGGGVLLGLALGTKLTAVLGLAGVALWGLWAWGSPRPESGVAAEAFRLDRPTSQVVWAGLAVATAAVVFVASDPFLYPDPVGRSWLLFQNRQAEMAAEQSAVPSRAVLDLPTRAALVWDRSLFHETWSNSYLGWPVEGVLAIVGLAWLAFRGVRSRAGPEALLLTWTLCVFGGVTWWLGFLLQHYFVPTAMMSVLLAGLGAAWVSQRAWQMAQWRWSLPSSRKLSFTPRIR